MKGNPSLQALLVLLASVALYVAAISPLSDSLKKARRDLSKLEMQLSKMELATAQQTDLKHRIEVLEATNALQRSEWIAPMLNSYAMRAKSILDTDALGAGLVNVEYAEGSLRALPLPAGNCIPERRTGRRSVRIRAQADFAAAASFLLRAERERPLMALQSLSILPQKGNSPDRQDISFVIEWPCRGEVVR